MSAQESGTEKTPDGIGPDGIDIEPTPDQLQTFLKGDRDEPILMINLLAYRDQAIYPPDSGMPPCSGREAYMKYGAIANAKINTLGGRIVMHAPLVQTVVGSSVETWDDIAIAFYPSRRAFIDMAVSMGDYPEAMLHRRAGLARTAVIQAPSDNTFSNNLFGETT